MTISDRIFSEESAVELSGLSEIFKLVSDLYGLNLCYYKPGTISRRIERRMKLQGCVAIEDYCQLLKNDAFELDHLYDDMLIGVTCFFRDGESFEWLRENIISELIEIIKEEGELRIWVAGCATGEEAYSLMILLCESIQDDKMIEKIRLFASDAYAPYVQKASSGTYTPDEIKQIPEDIIKKYFVKKDSGSFVISSLIRSRIVFSQHDITRDAPFSRLHFISCRNLLIYFNNEARIKALSTFHFTLVPGGIFFLGNSESVSPLETEFSTISRKHNLFRKTGAQTTGKHMRFSLKNRGLSDNGVRIDRTQPFCNDPRLMRAYDILLDRYMPVGFLLNNSKEIVHSFGNISDFIKPRPGRTSLNFLSLIDYNIGVVLNDMFGKLNDASAPVSYHTMTTEGKSVSVFIERICDPGFDSPYTLVLINEVDLQRKQTTVSEFFDVEGSVKRRVADLEQELFYTKEFLQSTIEELESSNEELLASSEEIQSTNEELQSTNEELCTVNKELEEKIDLLQTANSDLDNFIESTRIGTIFLDKALKIRLFTPSVSEIFDLIQKDIGRPIVHINSRLKNFPLESEIKNVIQTGKLFERDVTIENGKDFLLRIHPYVNENNLVDGAVIVFVNIDVLRKTETMFKRSEEKFRHVFEKMASGAAFFEPLYNQSGEIIDAVYVDVNKSYEKIFNMNKADLTGKALCDVFKDINSDWFEAYRNVFLTGKSVFVERYHAPTGKCLFSTCFKPEKDETYICVTHIDITDQKKAQKEMLHAEKMNAIGQLAGGVAHDFNNQLTGIMGYASLIVQNPENERVTEFAGQILKGAERSADLTQKLLAFSKKAKLVSLPVDINKELIEVVQLLKHSIDKKIVISTKICDQQCTVTGDSGQLQNAFLNLCLNARDAMPKGGMLEISTSIVTLDKYCPIVSVHNINPDLYVKISVRDTGRGIPKEIQQKIFEPFYTTRADEGGVGMGLAAVLGTVQSHNGAIELVSEVNRGSEFSIYLPSLGDGCKNLKDKTSISTFSLENSTIMVVDDEDIVRSIIVEILELHKSKVIPVSCGRDAIEVYKKDFKNIDLVFLDMVMPDYNGLETFRELKKINKNIKVIVLSGYSMNDEINTTINEGALGFVQKPVSLKVLIAALKEAMS
ncbi:MAG TPA: CheR family methyltransferase [bacterium]|nr:CheR family methyltransferase [bacterium]HPS30130.1 CheR family methyltransferase [bacterium]